MSRVVGIHGIGQQLLGPYELHQRWLPAINDGLARAGHGPLASTQLAIAFYGDLYRQPGVMAAEQSRPDAGDPIAEEELELLRLWASAAGAPTAEGALGFPPDWVRAALTALCRSRFWAGALGVTEAILLRDLRQVTGYFADESLRAAAIQRLCSAWGPSTRTVVAHSLGGVVAYEACWAAGAACPVRHLITLGSPLGIPRVIFDRLRPGPVDGRCAPPPTLEDWVNVTDRGDLVALVRELRPLFGDRVSDRAAGNESRAHDAEPYLTDPATGTALAGALDRERAGADA